MTDMEQSKMSTNADAWKPVKTVRALDRANIQWSQIHAVADNDARTKAAWAFLVKTEPAVNENGEACTDYHFAFVPCT